MTADAMLNELLALPTIWSPHVSDDGRWIAWTWYRAGPTANVYVAPTDGSHAPVRLTDTHEDTSLVSWTPDSRAVIVQHDTGGDERMRLFRVDVERPGEMMPLTEAAPPYYIRGGQLLPAGPCLVYAANVDDQGREIEASWLYIHNLATDTRRALARPQRGGYYIPQLNEQGTHILYARNDLHPAGKQVWLADIAGRDDREILNAGPDKKVHAEWFPDGRRVLFLAETGTHRRLGVWDMATGAEAMLIDDPARNIEHAFAPRGSDGAIVVVVEQHGARARVSLLEMASGKETALPVIAGDLIPLRDLGAGWWLGDYRRADAPDDLVRFRIDDPRPETFVSLTRVWERTTLRPGDLAPAEDFRWCSVDGMEIQGWLYRARGAVRGTILLIHGGPTWHAHDRLDDEVQYYASRGFNVLAPNYRGSTGFGLAYQEAIKDDGWGGREQDDIRTGIEALIAAGLAQAGKVGVTGTSYGGYSSWCQITRCPPELVAAAVPICGMTDLVVDYETTRPDLRPYSEEMLGGSPSQVPERYRERSPIHFVANIRGRLLIVQGLRDPNVTPENVRVVGEALQQAGVEYQLLAFEDEGHGISKVKNLRTLYTRLADFFEESFGG